MITHRTVTRPSDRFPDVGSVYAMGEVIRGHRWVRPVTAENPAPDLDSTRWPPTFVPDEEIAFAFDAGWQPSQMDLFGAAA